MEYLRIHGYNVYPKYSSANQQGIHRISLDVHGYNVYPKYSSANQQGIHGISRDIHGYNVYPKYSSANQQGQGRIQDFLKGEAGLAGLLRNLQSQGRSHTPPR